MFSVPSQFRHVVITGASSGIGAALARYYAANGVRLALLGRDRGRLHEVAGQCREAGAEICIATGDVADSAFMSGWLTDCDAVAPVDLIIANAGIGGRFVMAPPSGETPEAAREIFSTNVLGVANTILPLAPRFVERRSGHLVLIASLAGYIGLPHSPAYSASKAAVRIYAHGLRRLLAPHGVKVSVVCPGFVDTPMSASLSGPRPLLWDADRAARYVAVKVSQGRSEIAFPWPLAMLSSFAAILPAFILNPLLQHFKYGRRSA